MRNFNEIKIGGEFEISPEIIHLGKKDTCSLPFTLFSNGRSALMAILKDISRKELSIIYLPYYTCSSVLNACTNVGYKVKFYELDKDFFFPINQINHIESDSIILTTSYFGLVDDNLIIKKIKKARPDITTISDRVQNIWFSHESIADYSFTSLRKHIATPDGAFVYKKNEPFLFHEIIKENTFYLKKIQGSLSKFNQDADNIYLDLLEKGETLLENESQITKASTYGNYIYENIDKNSIIEKRKQNYKQIYEEGFKIGLEFIFPYSENTIPLCVPIRIKNQHIIRKQLISKNIFLPIHWPISNFNKRSKLAQEMATNELSLIIDQRYNHIQMEYQIKTLKKLNL